MNSMDQHLFACGDFQNAVVQERVFGHRLSGRTAAPVGYHREPFVQHSSVASERAEGMVFKVTDADLAAVDAYEPPDYRRSTVKTASGVLAWVYLRQN